MGGGSVEKLASKTRDRLKRENPAATIAFCRPERVNLYRIELSLPSRFKFGRLFVKSEFFNRIGRKQPAPKGCLRPEIDGKSFNTLIRFVRNRSQL